ncbi:hypothetical protein J5N97_000747 [Dioscorea zingiberensis]|uniref:Uncharacterized protein n=1 Tax=Dioscorea zingiberensis TaxID=325984 RepID=A0A9D5BUR4_9LILI|nr:hypothetical protein J5N97_000747 [Dioscorea zingiberensis]
MPFALHVFTHLLVKEEEDDSDDSDSEDDTTNQNAQILLTKNVISLENNSNWYSPLAHLKDAQCFAEKLFSRLQKCDERFEAGEEMAIDCITAALAF